MDHLDALDHVRGRSRYVDDEPDPADLLHGAVLASPVAHGRLGPIDTAPAFTVPGVVAVLTAEDIPGDNQIGPVIEDEPLLAEDSVHFQGQPIALVLASTPEAARLARDRLQLDIEELDAITDPEQAFALGHIIAEPQTLELGDVEAAWGQCHRVIEGPVDMAGQEHVYLETQRSRAHPLEGGALRVCSSTQSPYAGQRTIARVLGLALHDVEVDVRRLGGGFGGKEDQATPWACLAALGTHASGRPVEVVLRRDEDMVMTGKRHPYRCHFKIGVAEDGRVLAFEARHFQSSGAATDLSLAVLGRTVFHSTASYFVPNVRVFAVCCRTNLPPMTAFRGFGGPQGMFVIESALAAAAEALGMKRDAVQAKNLLSEGDRFPFGQVAEECRARRCFEEAVERFDVQGLRQRTAAWNRADDRFKKGFALMPVCFGISFTATFMNQASALVHVYTDGSVAVSTGGVEMGQGLSTNIAAIASRALGIEAERVRIESTNTRRIANMSPSAASATTLLNGNATLGACRRILRGLLAHAAETLGLESDRLSLVDERLCLDGEETEWDWPRLVASAYRARVSLSAHEFFATPDLYFDEKRRQGRPFAYHVYGTSLWEVTVDGLTGTYEIDAVRVVHDLGRSLNERVDLGQVEGGLVQGLGWMTLEDLRYAEDGKALSGALATYKVPDVNFVPDVMQVHFLENVGNELGPYQSKAVGEPPLMYGIGVFFALRNALRAFRPVGLEGAPEVPFSAPLTPEKAALCLHGHRLPPGLVGGPREGFGASEEGLPAVPEEVLADAPAEISTGVADEGPGEGEPSNLRRARVPVKS